MIDTLSEALQVALADPRDDALAELGTAPVAAERATPEATAKHVKEQLDLWAPIIEKAGVKAFVAATAIAVGGRPAAPSPPSTADGVKSAP